MEVKEEWEGIHVDDLWVYDKLILSKKLGYTCGPSGVDVPKAGRYVVRPITNYRGMGREATIEWIWDNTDHLHPSEFWCEVFEGEHISVDYFMGQSDLVVRGVRSSNELYKWDYWERVDWRIPFPDVLKDLKGNYSWINLEMIDGKVIEVHFRRNSDFLHGNTMMIPVWSGGIHMKLPEDQEWRYIPEEDYHREGYWIN